MYSQKKIFTAMLAISAGLAVAACNEEKTAAKPDDKSTTATAMDKAKDMAAKIEDKVEAAYRRGDLFEKRVGLMNDWARYIEIEPRPTSDKVVPIRGGA